MGSDFSNNSIVRFITCGSVDDGKSTLIGRLLLDSKAILEDQYSEIKRASEKKGALELDLSLLTDGLKEEREKGITIDVAYRYFSTPKRKFIIADTPGHKEFTRNMFTGASTASIAILLVDVNKGISEQTMRHAYINSLLKIPHLIVCFNKMDLCGFKEQIFDELKKDFLKKILDHIKFDNVRFIPVSALLGDNISYPSEKMPWFNYDCLLTMLEKSEPRNNLNKSDFRFVIQNVFTHKNNSNVIMGRILSGKISEGDFALINGSKEIYPIEKIELKGNKVSRAYAGQSITLFLKSSEKIKRGDILSKSNEQTTRFSQEFIASICWLSDKILVQGKLLKFHSHTQTSNCVIDRLLEKTEIETYTIIETPELLCANEFGKIKLKTDSPVLNDSYAIFRQTGTFILTDETTNETVAAGIIM
ncbi:MAG: sulfate adenylyltransferase subunit 1 [Bacteroidota bacterium]|jgi:sulfate adenylyltransferase subunit 1